MSLNKTRSKLKTINKLQPHLNILVDYENCIDTNGIIARDVTILSQMEEPIIIFNCFPIFYYTTIHCEHKAILLPTLHINMAHSLHAGTCYLLSKSSTWERMKNVSHQLFAQSRAEVADRRVSRSSVQHDATPHRERGAALRSSIYSPDLRMVEWSERRLEITVHGHISH